MDQNGSFQCHMAGSFHPAPKPQKQGKRFVWVRICPKKLGLHHLGETGPDGRLPPAGRFACCRFVIDFVCMNGRQTFTLVTMFF